jgi:hypothetical protein
MRCIITYENKDVFDGTISIVDGQIIRKRGQYNFIKG